MIRPGKAVAPAPLLREGPGKRGAAAGILVVSVLLRIFSQFSLESSTESVFVNGP